MKTIYITGISGLLGYAVARELSKRNIVLGADLISIDVPNCQVDIIDLQDKVKLEERICEVKPDVIIHTAAAINVDRCEEDKEKAYAQNVGITKNLVEICNENNIKLIYISTDAVFDGEKVGEYVEEDEVNPVNYYGYTKLEGENFVKKINSNLILRTNIYGINIQSKKSFGEWIVDELIADEELNMFTDIYFSPILVNDLAEVIDKCIEKDLCGLYHACGTGNMSKYDFGICVKEIFGIMSGKINKSTSEKMNFIAKRSKNMAMSNEKIKKELGIAIRTPRESIEKFKELYYEKKRGI